MVEHDDWSADDWSAAQKRSFTRALQLSPAERLAWSEEMIRLVWASGALPHERPENGDRLPPRSNGSSVARPKDGG